MESRKRVRNIAENLMLVILAFYPLRHIAWGLDLWDTGYNYANFQYFGTEHVDSMWLFSTYLANVTGSLLSRLPAAGSLIGMNFYTGLFVSLLAAAGYLFCTRRCGMPCFLTFLGEMAAISLCWCPTALLYNYLTYVLFLGSVILLYRGLTEERTAFLVLAGICLGCNVLVRFSNLPQAALIVAVWCFDGIKEQDGKSRWNKLWQHTAWCFSGYAGALAVLFGWIAIRYGFGNYIAGIQRLFAMTDTAEDYKATSMLTGSIQPYVENMYWVLRIGVIIAAGICLFAVVDWFGRKSCGWWKNGSTIEKGLQAAGKLLWVCVSGAMLVWLYTRGFCSTEFLQDGPISYGPILRPGILFLLLTLFIGCIRFFHKSSTIQEKLLSCIVVLILLITPLGSNNKLYPAMNNLFVAAPYTLWESWRFCKRVTGKRIKGILCSAFPVKGILLAFLGMCLFQFGGFGTKFVFAEATGVYNVTASVENNAMLKQIKMSPQKAQLMTEISEYAEEAQLQGQEVILYGYIPALSYYLQMPSAFNPWSDLDSYSYETMQAALLETEGRLQQGAERPVVIVNTQREGLETDAKWQLIVEYMERNGYELTWENEMLSVYR